MSKDKSLVIKINGDSKDLRDEFNRIKKETQDLDSVLSSVGKKSGIAFLGLSATVFGLTKTFANYEEGLFGVAKTTGFSGQQLENFGKRIQELSKEIPFATDELLKIAESAASLGVTGEENLLKFTKTIAMLGTASDISGEEAATSLTRILNVTKENISTIDTFASVIVKLGSDFAATESEIVRMTNEVSRSTAVFGVTSTEAAGISTALKSIGAQSELAGSVTGRAFRAIDEAVRGGGVAFQNLEAITGLTGDALRKTFKEDATIVFEKFVTGLGKVGAAGGDVTATLDLFGLKGDEVLKILPVLAGNSELLSKALATAANEAKNATALQREFAIQSQTLNSETTKLTNSISVVSQEIGAVFSPYVKTAVVALREFVSKFTELDPKVKQAIALFLSIATAVTGFITIAALGAGAVLTISAAFGALGIVAAPVVVTLGLISAAVVVIATNSEALQATLTGLQAVFTLATDSMQRGFNNVAIATTELLIKMKELGVATLEALNSEVFAAKIASMKANISSLEQSNERAMKSNAGLKRSFAEIYDEIDAPRMAKKVAEQEAAALAEREKAAKIEAERKAKEEEEKANAEKAIEGAKLERTLAMQEAEAARREAEHERRLEEDAKQLEEENLKNENALAAKAAYEATFSEIIRLENELRALEEGEFNNAQKVRVQAQLDSLKAIRDKSRTEEQKAVTNAQDKIRAAEALDKKQREEAEEADRKKREEAQNKFNKNTVDSTISLGKRIFDESTAAHKALLILNQRAALKSAFMDTRQAVMKAYASAPPPANYALAAAAAAFGAIQIADITSTALGLESGGLVGNVNGARAGDRYPAMLADGELVVPRKNFEQVVDGAARQRGFVKSGELGNVGDSGELVSRIEISLVDGAADFITAKQLENSRLGVNR